MAALIKLLSIPVMILNMFSGIIGGIWLGVLGNWRLIGAGLVAMVISTFGLPLAGALGLIFAAPGMMALEKGKTIIAAIIAGVLMALGNLWTYALVTAWCFGSFYVVLAHYETGSIWPYLLWAYSMATGPWTYFAKKDGETASSLGAFGACVGAVAMMGVILFKAHPSIVDLLIALCVPLAVVFFTQVWVGFTVAKAAQVANVQAEPPAKKEGASVTLFSKLFPDEKSRRSARVLKNCEQSLRGMHQARLGIESGLTSDDKALYCGPIVSTINVMCGRDGDDRFKPVDIELLLESLARFQRTGMLQAIMRLPRDLVETEILRACGIIFAQTMDLTDEAREAVFGVAKELDTLVCQLNRAVHAK